MLTSNLFSKVLIEPALNGANNLYIVSGYATVAMTFHHFQALRNQNIEINAYLIIGMTPQDGLSQGNHQGFQKLVQSDLANQFECSYVMTPPPVHSKIYAWFNDDKPVAGFMGSANYSQTAFGKNQREIMTPCNAKCGFDYFQSLSGDTIYCTHPDAENFVQVFNDKYYARRKREIRQQRDTQSIAPIPEISGLEYVRVSLINKFGGISERSGLNWGQRPEEHREPNQAYIPLKADVYKTDFFPPARQHFIIHTDDGKILICTRAQQSAKAIHTPHNNGLIGEYFRNRLDVPNGRSISMEDLLRYGRTDIDFYKIDEETYFMDFSPPQNG